LSFIFAADEVAEYKNCCLKKRFISDINFKFTQLKEIEERDIHFKHQSCLNCFER
jgi:hypothetical protein